MHVEITYRDGTSERLSVFLDGFRTASGPNWVPGHCVSSPSARCGMDRDFFETSMGEGHERSGVAVSDFGDYEPFRWELVGDEADECRGMLARWHAILGDGFDPVGPVPSELDPVLAAEFRNDQRCWTEWLDDPAGEPEATGGATAAPSR